MRGQGGALVAHVQDVAAGIWLHDRLSTEIVAHSTSRVAGKGHPKEHKNAMNAGSSEARHREADEDSATSWTSAPLESSLVCQVELPFIASTSAGFTAGTSSSTSSVMLRRG
jgi:hypothetical protein